MGRSRVNLIKDDKCPFCAQSITTNNLVAAYRACFSEAYRELQSEISDLQRIVTKTVGRLYLTDLR